MEKYRKVKMVGKGNFGYAILVQNIQSHKYYIMKVIDVSKMDNKQKNEALNEVIVLKDMRHPYIVAYRESFMNNKCLCIVMDYADGGDLYTKIAKHKKTNTLLPEDQLLDWFVKICLAIKHVHDKRILHRDLKTQNIFLTSNGDIKIGDFGIARVLQSTYDCAQTAIGTPYYLSPEICQEKPYNQKSDIWSLGCILYEMLTLKHAFDANNIKGLVLKILKGTYPPIPAQYSDNVKNLVAELLIKDPKKRPSIRKVLEKEFMKTRIQKIFEEATKKQELNYVKPKEIISSEEKIKQASSSEVNILKHNKENLVKKGKEDATKCDQIHASSSSISKVSSKAILKSQEYMRQVVQAPESEESKLPQKSTNDDDVVTLLSSLKKVLNGKAGEDEDGDFAEEEHQRARPQFLAPDGKKIPGLSEHDSMSYRIETLRVYLEAMLGESLLMKAYKILQEEKVNDEATEEAQRVLSSKKQYLGLLIQLIVCEESYYK
jgi:NIMA (never in mitosis gene a)-related kinase